MSKTSQFKLKEALMQDMNQSGPLFDCINSPTIYPFLPFFFWIIPYNFFYDTKIIPYN